MRTLNSTLKIISALTANFSCVGYAIQQSLDFEKKVNSLPESDRQQIEKRNAALRLHPDGFDSPYLRSMFISAYHTQNNMTATISDTAQETCLAVSPRK